MANAYDLFLALLEQITGIPVTEEFPPSGTCRITFGDMPTSIEAYAKNGRPTMTLTGYNPLDNRVKFEWADYNLLRITLAGCTFVLVSIIDPEKSTPDFKTYKLSVSKIP